MVIIKGGLRLAIQYILQGAPKDSKGETKSLGTNLFYHYLFCRKTRDFMQAYIA